VGNKIRSDRDRDFLLTQMPDFDFLGFIPYRTDIIESDLDGRPPFERDRESLKIVKGMLKKLQ
jgi:CO dehydrogenase maturation factor